MVKYSRNVLIEDLLMPLLMRFLLVALFPDPLGMPEDIDVVERDTFLGNRAVDLLKPKSKESLDESDLIILWNMIVFLSNLREYLTDGFIPVFCDQLEGLDRLDPLDVLKVITAVHDAGRDEHTMAEVNQRGRRLYLLNPIQPYFLSRKVFAVEFEHYHPCTEHQEVGVTGQHNIDQTIA